MARSKLQITDPSSSAPMFLYEKEFLFTNNPSDFVILAKLAKFEKEVVLHGELSTGRRGFGAFSPLLAAKYRDRIEIYMYSFSPNTVSSNVSYFLCGTRQKIKLGFEIS